MKQKNKALNITLIVLGVILLIIVFAITLGKSTPKLTSKEKKPLEKKNREPKSIEQNKKLIQNRYQKIQQVISKKETLKIKLDRIYKRSVNGFKIALVLLILIYNSIAYFLLELKNLGDIVNWNEAAILVIGFALFLLYDSVKDLKETGNDFKMKIKIRIYGKYINIDKSIEKSKSELKLLNQ